jgi:hypothetical protein
MKILTQLPFTNNKLTMGMGVGLEGESQYPLLPNMHGCIFEL